MLTIIISPADVKLTSGPNGSLDWLNCGIESGGWTPPHIAIDDLVYVNLADVAWKEGSPFKPCAPYISQFEAHAGENGCTSLFVYTLLPFHLNEIIFSPCHPPRGLRYARIHMQPQDHWWWW